MKVYLDTGFFIDYLSSRGPIGDYLRSATRKGRKPPDLATDADKCFELIEKNHDGMTSSLTFYEVEEAFYKVLSRKTSGIAHVKKYLIPTARSIVPQLIIATELYRIRVLAVTGTTIKQQVANLSLQLHSIRAADALHVTSAISNDADVFITTDDGILALDKRFKNKTGKSIRFLDSDAAIVILTA